jgi:YD repeat-containing protein
LTDSCEAALGATSLPAASRKFSTQWHPDWSIKARIAEPGRITSFVYNGQPDPSAGGVAAACAPASATLPDGKPIAVLCKQVEQATTDSNGTQGFAAPLQAGVPAREQRWTYNEYGQVLTHDGPRTDVADITTHLYYADTAFSGADPYAVGHTRGDLRQTTSPSGHVTRYTSYNKAGQLLEMVDANDVTTSHTYDLRQRMTSTTVGGLTTSFAYWPTGLIQRITQPDGNWVHYEHDAAHRLIKVSDNLGNSVSYTLDNLGNRTSEDVRDPANVLRRQLTRSIDALGRVQLVTGRE